MISWKVVFTEIYILTQKQLVCHKNAEKESSYEFSSSPQITWKFSIFFVKFLSNFSSIFFSIHFFEREKNRIFAKNKSAWVKWARGLARAKVLDFDGSNQISFFSSDFFLQFLDFFTTLREKGIY